MSVEIVWSPLALARLQEIRSYVALDKPQAAERLATRIVAAVEALKDYPHLGRRGSIRGTRELVIGRTPYIVIYTVRADQVIINTIWHGALKTRSPKRPKPS
jgi:toxin ParE1/3/4